MDKAVIFELLNMLFVTGNYMLSTISIASSLMTHMLVDNSSHALSSRLGEVLREASCEMDF